MFRLSKLVQDEEDFMKKETEKIYTEIKVYEDLESKKQINLDLKKFNSQAKVIKSKILLYTITRLMGNSKGIEKVHIEDILKLCDRNIGNKFLMPNKNLKILIKNGQINFESKL